MSRTGDAVQGWLPSNPRRGGRLSRTMSETAAEKLGHATPHLSGPRSEVVRTPAT